MSFSVETVCINNVQGPVLFEHFVFDYSIRNAARSVVTRCMLAHPSDIPPSECPVASRWTLLRSTLAE